MPMSIFPTGCLWMNLFRQSGDGYASMRHWRDMVSQILLVPPHPLSTQLEDVRRKMSLQETEESWGTIQQDIVQVTGYCNDSGCVGSGNDCHNTFAVQTS